MLDRPRSPGSSILVLLAATLVPVACKHDDAKSDSGSTSSSGTADDAGTSATATSGATMAEGGDPGAPPPTPTLAMPTDGATEVPIAGTQLCWNLVEDPDGDPVRYRVFVDDIELTEGKLGEPGYEGPCVGPLDFVYEQTYSWQVQAFHPDIPTSESARSDAWSFTTDNEGFTQTVFEDPFDDDMGWTVGGDALSGAWERGDPVGAMHLTALSQPDDCAGGTSCYYTGQNPGGIDDMADVAGGSTTLTSPAFDLSGFVAATVQISRFVYKSEEVETGTLFRVELLTPDAGEPDGYRHFVLEQLEDASDVEDANMWTPNEYSACGLPMVAGTRLRVTATDLGNGIFESAIDSVVVTGYEVDDVCTGGVGAICDPTAPQPCAEGLSCCAKGVLNTGVFRCAEPVPSLDYANPPAQPDDPGNGPMGCDAPDLFVEEAALNLWEDQINVEADDCVMLEGCVGAPGVRKVLKFTTTTPNIGSKDLTMGVPSNHPDLFHYSDCHMHYHFDGYALYELLDGADVVASGHKQAFCLLDWESWAWGNGVQEQYTCGNQGIGRGWYDEYGDYLDCQWIDITDVAAGNYTLRISVNPPKQDTAVPPLNERDYSNNVLEVPVEIQ
jgi:hypothetical protein